MPDESKSDEATKSGRGRTRPGLASRQPQSSVAGRRAVAEFRDAILAGPTAFLMSTPDFGDGRWFSHSRISSLATERCILMHPEPSGFGFGAHWHSRTHSRALFKSVQNESTAAMSHQARLTARPGLSQRPPARRPRRRRRRLAATCRRRSRRT
jgi:hypothetical protein